MSQGTIRTRIVNAYRTPVDALRLNEDIRALERAIRELKTVDRYNVQDDPDADTLWMIIQKLWLCQRTAQQKLRTEFLDPRRKKI